MDKYRKLVMKILYVAWQPILKDTKEFPPKDHSSVFSIDISMILSCAKD